MSYEIIETSFGPLVKHNETYGSLQDFQTLFDVMEEDPTFADAMKEHILASLENAMSEITEAFTLGIGTSPSKLYGYLNSISAHTSFMHQHWPNYLRSIQQAQQA
jgi:hypothetical protein